MPVRTSVMVGVAGSVANDIIMRNELRHDDNSWLMAIGDMWPRVAPLWYMCLVLCIYHTWHHLHHCDAGVGWQ